MADNVTLNAGSGGDAVRTKDRAGVETTILGIDLNINGSESLMNGVLPSVGDVAHDVGDDGAPVKLAALARTTVPTSVTEADRAALLADTTGRLWTTYGFRTHSDALSFSGDSISFYCGDAAAILVIPSNTNGSVNFVYYIAAEFPVVNPLAALFIPITSGSLPMAWTQSLVSSGNPQVLLIKNYGFKSVYVQSTGTSSPVTLTFVMIPETATQFLSMLLGNISQSTGATHVLKLEDGASATADAGVGGLAVRKATPVDSAADADYTNPQMSLGQTFVDSAGSRSLGLRMATYTSQQTGSDVIAPGSGLKIAVTMVTVASYGNTGGRLILWFGDNGDTTFTQDTDQVLIACSLLPVSAGRYPIFTFNPRSPVFCNTADRELHITTDAALSVDVTITYYEF